MSTPDLQDLLSAPAAAWRLEGIRRCEDDGRASLLRPLLEDDAPFVFSHGDALQISEVRFRALDALEAVYKRMKKRPDFGPVTVRRAAGAADVRREAQAALDGLNDAEEIEALAAVDLFLNTRVQPGESERPLLRDYRLLQHLGLLDYRVEQVDPETWLTPLQAEVIASQVASDRPVPHLQLSQKGRTLGYVYREGGRWAMDFSEDHDARRAARRAQRVLTGIDKAGIPRVLRDASGAPQRSDSDSLVLDGVVPLNGEPLEVLRSLEAFVGSWYDAALREA